MSNANAGQNNNALNGNNMGGVGDNVMDVNNQSAAAQ